MEVLLLKDVSNLGLAGQVKKVNEGYARNFLFPNKLAITATTADVERFKKQISKKEIDTQIAGSRVAMLSEQIKNLKLVLKKKSNENGKLYGAIGAEDVVELLEQKNIHVEKKQIEFPKAIRTTGEYEIIVRLTSKLKPNLTLKVEGIVE